MTSHIGAIWDFVHHYNSGLAPSLAKITVCCALPKLHITIDAHGDLLDSLADHVEMGGFEPPTPALRRQCSPTELHPL